MSDCNQLKTCELCNTWIGLEHAFHKHLRKCHGSDDVYTCEHCNYATHHKKDIYTHVTKNHNAGLYKCDPCVYETVHKNIFKSHLMNHDTHKSTQKDEKNKTKQFGKPVLFKCSVCGYNNASDFVMRQHMEVKHGASLSGSKKLMDNKNKIKLNKRIKEHNYNYTDTEHYEEKGMMYNCAECHFICEQASTFMEHLTQTHKEQQSSDADANMPSVNLNMALSTETEKSSDIYVHVRTNDSGLSLFKCLICGYFCEHQRTIKSHIWKHSGHKKLDYPIFQNGPLSVYDQRTPLGKTSLICKRGNAVVANMSLTDALQSGINESQMITPHPHPLNIEHDFTPAQCIEVASEVEIDDNVEVNITDGMTYSGPNRNIVDHHYAATNKTLWRDTGTTHAIIPNIEDSHTHSKRSSENMNSLEDALSLLVKRFCVEKGCKSVIVQNVSHYTRAPETHLATQSENVTCTVPGVANSDKENYQVELEHVRAAKLLTEFSNSCSSNDSCNEDVDVESLNEVPPTTMVVNDDNDILLKDDIPASQGSDTTVQRKGISSSLLAVIEQLRERAAPNDEYNAKGSQDEDFKHSDTTVNFSDKDSCNIQEIVSEQVLYRCQVCHYTNAKLPLLKVHMKQHQTKDRRQCPLCSYFGTSSEDLQQHALQHCHIRTFHCKICASSFNYKSQLRAHTRAHEELNSKKQVCKMCHFYSNCALKYQEHMSVHHDIELIEKFCGCTECTRKETQIIEGKTASVINEDKNIDKMKTTNGKSVATINTSTQPLFCEYCDFKALSVRSLKSHMKRHFNDRRTVQKPLEQYKCTLCGYVCTHLPSLKSHMWRHASETDYSYTMTNSMLNAALQQNSTRNNVSASKQSSFVFSCCVCGFESNNQSILDDHMLIHMLKPVTKS